MSIAEADSSIIGSTQAGWGWVRLGEPKYFQLTPYARRAQCAKLVPAFKKVLQIHVHSWVF